MAIILPYKGKFPKIAEDAFIADNAVIIGDVEIGSKASVWFGCVVRGDVNHIRIGRGTNIQDGTVIHVNRNDGPTIIGEYVTVGHLSLLHACTLKDYAFVGMGAKVIDNATVESYAMVAAGTLISPNKIVASKQLWAGIPGKFFRDMTQAEIDYITISADNYMRLWLDYV